MCRLDWDSLSSCSSRVDSCLDMPFERSGVGVGIHWGSLLLDLGSGSLVLKKKGTTDVLRRTQMEYIPYEVGERKKNSAART